MSSEIRVNKINNRAGLGTVTYTDTGIIVSGISTASNFKTGTSDLHSAGINVAYADVDDFVDVGSNIKLGNAGVVTATTFSTANVDVTTDKIVVGTGVTIEANQVATGQATFTGIVTASAFKLADGSNVGGVESDAQSNTIGGTDAGINLDNDTYSNTFFGHSSGKQINSGDENAAVGQYSLQNGTSATSNSCFGYGSGRQTTGNYNTLIGRNAGTSNQSGTNNTALGYNAGDALVSGSNNIIIGASADVSAATVSNEVTIGDSNINHLRVPGIGVSFSEGGGVVTGIMTASAFKLLDGSNVGGIESDGSQNTVGGTNAGDSIVSGGTENTVFGYNAGTAISTGDNNTFFGSRAGRSISTGLQNTGVGYNVMGNTSGTGNAALGQSAGNGIGAGSYNVALGWSALSDVSTNGANNIVIGKQANVSAANMSNEITLGNSDISHFRIPGIGVSFGRSGATIAGVVTATSFSGDGSSLSNLPASAPVGGASTNTVFFENDTAVAVNYQVTSGKNAMSAGPIAINAGIAVTVPSGSAWTIV